MKTKQKIGTSFLDNTLAFQGNFHSNQTKKVVQKKQEGLKSPMFARYDRAIQRKITHAKKRLLGINSKKIIIVTEKHQYQYKQFGDQPAIDFSGISLIILSPFLLRINFTIAKNEGITMVQFIFVTFFISFIFNLIFILRKNRLMPYLPTPQKDNKLKIAALLAVIAVYFSLQYGWSASGGMIFAIIWQSLAGRQGCFYLIIFGAIVGGSLTMEWTSPKQYFLKIISSILFGISQSIIHGLKENSPYAILNQISLFITLGTVCLYTIMEVQLLSMWQYLILLILGFSVYFNLLLIVKLMQTQRVSIVMGIVSGIIIISATNFVTVSDYVACLTIVLSILVLLKMEFLDQESSH